MTYYGTCERCGEPVEAPQTPAYPITGWEVGRSGGGANAIRNRERIPDRVRHMTCLPDKAGQERPLSGEPGDGSLFG
jgi:hypothetical protein